MMNCSSQEIQESDTSSEIECFLDLDNEIFFGPITEREREIRKPLPRRTLHPKYLFLFICHICLDLFTCFSKFQRDGSNKGKWFNISGMGGS